MSHLKPLNLDFFDDLLFPPLDNEEDWDLFFNFKSASPTPFVNSQDSSHLALELLDSPSQQQQPSSSTEIATSAEPWQPVDLIPTDKTPATEDLSKNGDANKQDQQKRGIQDCLSSFFIDESAVLPPRKRQAFSSKEREKVALVRNVRACQRCRMRKLSVSPTFFWRDHPLIIHQCEAAGVCDQCVNSAASNVSLGEHIC
jgi:hypothetical protein